MIQNSLLRTQSTLFAMQMTQTTLVHGIYGITYALGEYDPGSAQDGRTSSDFPVTWKISNKLATLSLISAK